MRIFQTVTLLLSLSAPGISIDGPISTNPSGNIQDIELPPMFDYAVKNTISATVFTTYTKQNYTFIISSYNSSSNKREILKQNFNKRIETFSIRANSETISKYVEFSLQFNDVVLDSVVLEPFFIGTSDRAYTNIGENQIYTTSAYNIEYKFPNSIQYYSEEIRTEFPENNITVHNNLFIELYDFKFWYNSSFNKGKFHDNSPATVGCFLAPIDTILNHPESNPNLGIVDIYGMKTVKRDDYYTFEFNDSSLRYYDPLTLVSSKTYFEGSVTSTHRIFIPNYIRDSLENYGMFFFISTLDHFNSTMYCPLKFERDSTSYANVDITRTVDETNFDEGDIFEND